MNERTASPRYSSRSLFAPPWLRCVNARASSPGSENSTPSRSASQRVAGSTARSARVDDDRLVELDEERDVAGERHGIVVVGAHRELAAFLLDLDVRGRDHLDHLDVEVAFDGLAQHELGRTRVVVEFIPHLL